MSCLSIRLLPYSEDHHVHHLLHVSGVVVFENITDWRQWIRLNVSHNERLAIPDQAAKAGNIPNEFKELASVVLFDLSDVESKISLLKNIAQGPQELFVLAGKEPTLTQLNVLEELRVNRDKIKMLILENKNNPMDEVLSILPKWLRGRTSFVYLPKRNSADCLLNPEEIVERIQFRTSQCKGYEEQFELVSFGSGTIDDPLLAKFFAEPSLDLFLEMTEKQNYLKYFFLTLIRSTGLAGILGFVFWILKVLLNPSGYNIWQELRGWGFRGFGWIRGSLIDIKGLIISGSVKYYWWFRGVFGRSWQLRVMTQSLLGQRWRLKVYLQKLLSQRWRLKVSLQNLLSQRWRVKVFFISLVSNSWKIKVFLQRLIGQAWRFRVFLIRFRWWIVGLLWWIKGFISFAVSNLFWSVCMPLWRIASFPFKKVYWFFEYQYKKRIKKNLEVDDGK